jgi:uncharacterized protein YbjT (DUF2867 family)
MRTKARRKNGSSVVTQLAEKKISATAGVHSQAKASALPKTGIEATVLDFESPESIAPAFKGIDRLFLVTPGSLDQGPHEENLLAEAKKVGVKRIVEIVGGKSPITTPLASRSGIARLSGGSKESGISYTILRGNYFIQRMKTARSGAQSPFEL